MRMTVRTRIGVVYPDDPWVDQDIQDLLEEIRLFLPTSVEIVSAHQYVPPRDVTVEEVVSLAESPDIEIAAQRLMRFNPGCFAYLCTAASFIKGVEHDTDISDRIEEATGVPAITTSTAVVKALKVLGVKKTVTVSPYLRDLDQKLTEFLEDNGFQVVKSSALCLPQDQGLHPPERIRQAVEKTDRPEADGIFISCTGLRTAAIIDDLEKELGKPVVTANQATMWCALQMLGIEPRLPGLGRLYKG
jgi:maleate isomerase